MTQTTVRLDQIEVGDVILPPERELRLWMRRHAREHSMSDSALNLTVIEVIEGRPDKRGAWMILKTKHDQEWNNTHLFTFKARPGTNWPRINKAANP